MTCSSPLPLSPFFAAAAAAALALAGLRSTTGPAATPLCAPAVVTGAFSIERRGRERKRRAGEEERAAAEDDETSAGEGAAAAAAPPPSLLELLGAFSTENTVAPLGVAAPGTLQAETATSTPSSLFLSGEDAATLGAVRHRRGVSTLTSVSGSETKSSIEAVLSPPA